MHEIGGKFPPIFFQKIFAANNNACIFAFHFGNGVAAPGEMLVL